MQDIEEAGGGRGRPQRGTGGGAATEGPGGRGGAARRGAHWRQQGRPQRGLISSEL